MTLYGSTASSRSVAGSRRLKGDDPNRLPFARHPRMQIYAAKTILAGEIRRMWFEAPDEAEAKGLAVRFGAGLEGLASRPEVAKPLPEAYDAKTARLMLGGISRTSLYKEIILGRLKRVAGTRRVLITRSSLELRCR